MSTSSERYQALKDILEQRVLVIDGAMGTMIHAAPLSIETDYLGRENCPEILNVLFSDVIQHTKLHYWRSDVCFFDLVKFVGAVIELVVKKRDGCADELN